MLLGCHPELRRIGTNKLDSGSQKGNPCYNVAKVYKEIVLFEPFEIPHQVRNDVSWFLKDIPNR
jgi:hypothetical protein